MFLASAHSQQGMGGHSKDLSFLDALASLDLKLSVSQSVSDSPFSDFQ